MAHRDVTGSKLPFGKFKGQSLAEIPSSYLSWLLEQDWFEDEYVSLFDDVQEENRWREETGSHFND